MPLKVRKTRSEDIPELVNLMDQLGYPIDPVQMEDNLRQYTSLGHQQAWVAEIEGKVVGCIACAITRYFHRPGSFLRVIALVVDKEYRRLGIGKALMRRAELQALEQGCTHVELTSGVHRAPSGSHAFYGYLGYLELNDRKKYFGKLLPSPNGVELQPPRQLS